MNFSDFIHYYLIIIHKKDPAIVTRWTFPKVNKAETPDKKKEKRGKYCCRLYYFLYCYIKLSSWARLAVHTTLFYYPSLYTPVVRTSRAGFHSTVQLSLNFLLPCFFSRPWSCINPAIRVAAVGVEGGKGSSPCYFLYACLQFLALCELRAFHVRYC